MLVATMRGKSKLIPQFSYALNCSVQTTNRLEYALANIILLALMRRKHRQVVLNFLKQLW